jgi:hypothetical protein
MLKRRKIESEQSVPKVDVAEEQMSGSSTSNAKMGERKYSGRLVSSQPVVGMSGTLKQIGTLSQKGQPLLSALRIIGL